MNTQEGGGMITVTVLYLPDIGRYSTYLSIDGLSYCTLVYDLVEKKNSSTHFILLIFLL